MPKELIHSATLDGCADSRRVELGWNREGGFVQLATYDGKPADGLFVDLDRTGINRLIAKLRRARDQVFGRDE